MKILDISILYLYLINGRYCKRMTNEGKDGKEIKLSQDNTHSKLKEIKLRFLDFS